MALKDDLKNLDIETLRKIKTQKLVFDNPQSTEAQKLAASTAADRLRADKGLSTDSQGVVSLSELNEIISGREKAAPVTISQAPQAQPSLIDQLSRVQEEQQIAALKKAKEGSLSALTAEQEAVSPAFAQQRSSARATSRLQGQNFKDYLASRGISRSGGAALGETQRLGALQGALGALGQQEAATLSDIERRRSGIESGFLSDVAAARAGIQAQALQNTIDQQRSDQQLELQRAGLTGVLGGEQTLAGRQLGLQAQSQEFNQALNTAQFNENVRQFENQFGEDVRRFNQQFGLDLRQQSFAEAQAQIDNAFKNRQLSQTDYANALREAEFVAKNDPMSLDNQIKQRNIALLDQELNNFGNTVVSGADLEPFIDVINQQFVGQTAEGQPTFDDTNFRDYLSRLSESGVNDDIVLSIGQIYGVSPVEQPFTPLPAILNRFQP